MFRKSTADQGGPGRQDEGKAAEKLMMVVESCRTQKIRFDHLLVFKANM
jgi:hypothetical protein